MYLNNKHKCLSNKLGSICDIWQDSILYSGIKEATSGSCLFFFTDADAKDENRFDEVIQLIKAKNINAIFLLRGSCGTSAPTASVGDFDESTCISRNPRKCFNCITIRI